MSKIKLAVGLIADVGTTLLKQANVATGSKRDELFACFGALCALGMAIDELSDDPDVQAAAVIEGEVKASA